MKLSDVGFQKIVEREGLRLEAYLCIAGRWTIGIGHTNKVRPGMKITREQAQKFFDEDMLPVTDYLNYTNTKIPRRFQQHEFDALCSFIHQIGLPSFVKSTCLKKIRAGASPEEIAKEFPKWSYITDPVTKQKVWSDSVHNRHLSEKRQYVNGY